jgi:hypothetical protein
VAQLEDPAVNPTVARLDTALRATGQKLVLGSSAYRSSIDETLLARNLRLTPAERLAAFERAHGEVEALRSLKPNAG